MYSMGLLRHPGDGRDMFWVELLLYWWAQTTRCVFVLVDNSTRFCRAMEAAQQRLVVETAQQSAAVAAAERAEHRERSRRRRTQRKHRIGGASGTSTSVHLCAHLRLPRPFIFPEPETATIPPYLLPLPEVLFTQ